MRDIQDLRGRGFGNVLRNGASGVALAMALGLPGVSYAGVLPSHGHFASGTGSINKANRSLTVKQSSTTGIIDWKSFSVGKHDGVSIDNGSGATLNRVSGGNLSTIAGSLRASGSLYLMNSSGVIISGTGRVVTGGSFVASSGAITNDAFENDRLRITNGKAAVINHGSIVSSGGVRLVGSDVSNTGSIKASRIKLWAARKLVVDGQITAQKSTGTGGAVIAHGHTISVSGHIDASATAAHRSGGTIVIDARGTTTVSGKLTAEGGRHGTGGFVETSGEHVHVANSARISTLASHGATGTWLIDPTDFVIAPSGGDTTGAELSTNLATTDELIQSGGGSGGTNGDVIVDDDISWSSAQSLTLDAYRNIDINAHISVTGAGNLVLINADHTQTSGVPGVNDANAADGDLLFGTNGDVQFTAVASGNTTQLAINGNAYTLENNVADLSVAIAGNASGNYALAKNYDASGDNSGTAYAASPIQTTFTGTFEGLGNAISDLTINDTTETDNVGLFAVIGTGGVVRDIGLTNVNIQAADGSHTGALAGEMDGGTIAGSYSTGTVGAGADDSKVGGLVGLSTGTMTADHSSATETISDASVPASETADVGGLVGDNDGGAISYSYATGAVSDTTQARTGSEAIEQPDAVLGGLVGLNDGNISYSYASGAVTGETTDYVGGLVGETEGGTISYSYATGNVVAAYGKAGGFAGDAGGGTISGSYATGAVSDTTEGAKVGGLIGYVGGAAIDTSYATGNVTDVGTGTTQGSGKGTSDVGGLVGDIDSGSVTKSYASGTVVGGSDADAGGFIGLNEGTVDHSYAIGPVSGGGLVGGFIGQNGSSGTVDESYSIGKATGSLGSFVGGFAGDNDNSSGISASVGDYYNSTVNTGVAIGADGAASPSDVHGLTTSQMRIAASFSEWTDFGTTAGGSGWVIVDQDGSLNNASGATGGTTPMLLSEFSTTITNAHQLQLMELNSGAHYTLANNIDASATGAGNDVWGSQGFISIGGNSAGDFTGSFDGQGHVIDGVTVGSSANSFSGLFGLTDNATIENLGLTNVSVTGASDGALAGGLVGDAMNSTISNVYVTGQITGGTASAVGGIIGAQLNGTVSQSWADATVIVGASAHGNLSDAGEISGDMDGGAIEQSFGSGIVEGGGSSTIGGLAGFISDGATINNSYAMVAVVPTGTAGSAGGIAGYEAVGTIENSYATGIVMQVAGNNEGGLVGLGGNSVGSVLANSYWDTQTTGQSQPSGSGPQSGATAQTTAQLQSALPSGFDSTVWGTGPGLFPYFRWQYPSGTPQAVSGMAYSDYKTTALSDGSVSLLIDGHATGTTSTGADGYYYFLEAPGTISGNTVLTYLPGTGGVAFADNATGSVSGLDIDNNYLSETTAGSSYTTLASDLASAISGNSAVQTIVNGLANQSIDYTGNAAFNIDSGIDLGSGTLAITASGGVNQTEAIQASKLLLLGTADYTLSDSDNAIATVAGHTTGSLNLTDGEALTVGSVNGTSGLYVGGGTTLATTSGDITITQSLIADNHPLTLTSAGAITESGLGEIDALSLNGSSGGTTTLNGANLITDLGAFTSGSTFKLTDDHDLTVDGTINGGAHTVELKTTGSGHDIKIGSALEAGEVELISAATISETSVGAIEAKTLTGSSVGSVALTASKNAITDLGTFTSGSTFELTDDHDLTVDGTVNSGTANTHLTTTGSGHDIAIDAKIEADDIYLISAATITESSAGDLDATKLTGSSVGTAEINSATNTISDLGTFTSGSTFELTDDHDLTVDGTMNSGAANTHLTTTGSGHDIAIEAKIEADDVYLVSAATITESSSGDLDATKLSGSSVGTAEMNSATNTITDLGTFTSGSTFELTDDHDLKVDGTVNSGTANTHLATTGSGHDIAIDAKIEAHDIYLISAATITESSAGDLDATKLTGSSVGTAEINSATNTISDLGTFTSGSTFELTDDHDLTVDGTVNSGTANTHLTTTGSGHDIAIDAEIEADDIYLVSAATITESSSGDLDVTKLSGSSMGTAEMNSATNTLTDLGTFSTGGNNAFELTDDHALTVDGIVNAGTGTLDLTTTGSNHNLAIDAAITGGTINLVTTGEASESSSNDAISASLLNVVANTGIELTSSKNKIKKLGTDKTKTGPNKVTL